MTLFSLTCAAQRDRIQVKHNENDKSLTSCSKAASYFKVTTETALRVRSEAKVRHQLLREVKVSGAIHARICIFQQPQYVLQTENSSNSIWNLDRYFESINQSNWKHPARPTLGESHILFRIASLACWKWRCDDVHNKTTTIFMIVPCINDIKTFYYLTVAQIYNS